VLNQIRVVGLRRGCPRWAVAWSVPPGWREREPAPNDTGNRQERRAAKRQRKGREGE
jgi:hypothetical protein